MEILFDSTASPHTMQLLGSNGFPLRSKSVENAILEAKNITIKLHEKEGTFSSMNRASALVKAIDLFEPKKITIQQKDKQ